jgi:predicted phage tail component-like protein
MARMIQFNGIAMDGAANVRLTDIVVSPMQVRETVRERTLRSGADFVRVTGGTRTVTVSFVLLDQDRTRRQEALLAVNAWACSDTPGRIVLHDHPGRYLTRICTSYPEPSLRQWWGTMQIVWTCYDPYWYAMQEKTVPCGTAFRALGSAAPYVRITDTVETAGSRTYSDGTNTMTFSDVPAGALEIDLERQTAAVDGASIMQGFAFTSAFLPPRREMTITGSGTVHYRERWV